MHMGTSLHFSPALRPGEFISYEKTPVVVSWENALFHKIHQDLPQHSQLLHINERLVIKKYHTFFSYVLPSTNSSKNAMHRMFTRTIHLSNLLLPA